MRQKRRLSERRREPGALLWVGRKAMPVTNVLIADREKATRAACVRVVRAQRRMRVVGEAQSGLEVVTATARLKPQIVLLDLKLSSEFGATLISVLRRKSARTRVILLVGRASEAKILEALSHGAVGYVKKNQIQRFLPEALHAVSSGEAWMSRRMIPKIMDTLAAFTARAEGRK
jgi:DNA-binding NarL/FixJ family response regulator